MTHVRRGEDDRGSIPLLMLVMLLGIAFTALLVPVVINMNATVNFNSSRVVELNAAQGGVDVMIGKIRSASDGDQGDPSELPCTTVAALTGDVQSSGSTVLSSYSVLVDYYTQDPVANPSATPMTCVPGAGTYDPQSGKPTPSYAKITSTGTSTSSNKPGASNHRTLVAVYALHVDNQNINGGTVRVYSATGDGSSLYCLDAGSASPAAGTRLTLQTCSTSVPTAAQQTFAYRNDLTLQLVSSFGVTVGGTQYRNGLCVDIANLTSGNSAPATNSPVVLKQCVPSGGAWSQQWSFNSHRSYQAPLSSSATDTAGTLSTLCMTVAATGSGANIAHAAGAPVYLNTCDNSLTSATDAWVPSPAVGAGAATTPASNQWINFQQFGRCLDVPNSDPNALYLTVPNCFQNPNQAAIADNQKLTYDPTTKRFTVKLGTTTYCLYSKLPTAAQTNVVDHLVRVTNCSSHSGIANNQLTWTRTTPDTDPTLSYSEQYRFKDVNGQCLSIADVQDVAGDSYGSTYNVWQKAVTEGCDYSSDGIRQMWNATNNIGNASVQNVVER